MPVTEMVATLGFAAMVFAWALLPLRPAAKR